MYIHELQNPIDVYVRSIGHCKALFLLDYGTQVNTMWKVRVYATGRVLNAYDDDIIIYGNPADGEALVPSLPTDWKTD